MCEGDLRSSFTEYEVVGLDGMRPTPTVDISNQLFPKRISDLSPHPFDQINEFRTKRDK